MFLFILWEGVIARRALVFAGVCGTSLEYSQHGYPLPHHNWRTNPLIYAYPKGSHHHTVGFMRVLKMRSGLEAVVTGGGNYSDGALPDRGQGWV